MATRTRAAKRSEKVQTVIGYLRVSTDEQDLEKNKADILHLANDKGLPCVEWVEEKVSGTKNWRKRRIGEALKSLQSGDAFIVPELSRLGRSTLQILEIMEHCKRPEVAVYAVKGGWTLNGSMDSKIVLTMLALFAEIERDLISQRTKEGLRARRAQGVKPGRPNGPGKSKLDQHREAIIEDLKRGVTKTIVAGRYGTSKGNLFNWLKKHKLDIKPE